ncbi:zinc-dependent metalloprotease [Microbacterium indicum]|uniref:zinc-dependent metalloprotease n=1 Tax=Microbacterium indicum TaxID=358100 RepID=UPI000414DF7A
MSDDNTPEDDFQEMLRRLLGDAGGDAAGLEGIDLSQLGAAGIDPAMMQQMMGALQAAFRNESDEISWDSTRVGALHLANRDDRGIASGDRADLDQAFHLADLWLGEATEIPALAASARVITRGEWVEMSLPVWQELAEPVATSIADALTRAMREQAPDDMQQFVQNAGRMLRQVGGSLFAAQLGQVIGKLSLEVVSGGDVGIPVLPAGTAAILPQNFADLGEGLEIPADQLALYVAARELAHARLFAHARWLRLHVMSQVTDYARGLEVDTDSLEDLATRFDPSHPEELQEALSSGALLPQQSEAQTQALARLETMLALIEGWVDVVSSDATKRVPQLARIAEAIRRRRAVGGPAEDALKSLVGLQLRPRRLREAAAMWRSIGDAVGASARDALWDYPDLVPTAEDIDDPSALIARLEARARGDEAPRDTMDDEIAKLLADAAGEGSEGDQQPGGPTPV